MLKSQKIRNKTNKNFLYLLRIDQIKIFTVRYFLCEFDPNWEFCTYSVASIYATTCKLSFPLCHVFTVSSHHRAIVNFDTLNDLQLNHGILFQGMIKSKILHFYIKIRVYVYLQNLFWNEKPKFLKRPWMLHLSHSDI